MKLSNLASLDPIQKARGIRGLSGASQADREIWNEFTANWEKVGTESEECFQELVGIEFSKINYHFVKQTPKISRSNSQKSPPHRIIEKTEAQVTTKTRIGQSFFRNLQEFLPEATLEHNFVTYAGNQLNLPGKFQPESEFLRFHREKIFLGA